MPLFCNIMLPNVLYDGRGMVADNGVGELFQGRYGVLHCEGEACCAQMVGVVDAVADGDRLGVVNTEVVAQGVQAVALACRARHDLDVVRGAGYNEDILHRAELFDAGGFFLIIGKKDNDRLEFILRVEEFFEIGLYDRARKIQNTEAAGATVGCVNLIVMSVKVNVGVSVIMHAQIGAVAGKEIEDLTGARAADAGAPQARVRLFVKKHGTVRVDGVAHGGMLAH